MKNTEEGPRSIGRWAATTAAVVLVGGVATAAASTAVTMPLVCNQGPSDQRFRVRIDVPQDIATGDTYAIRIDGSNSGRISHFGLNYLHDMTVDYILPASVAYVEGSATLVPGTGSANVLAGARVDHRAGVVTMRLPGRVANGSDYTPPSISLEVRPSGTVGSQAVVLFDHFQLKANAFLVGDVQVSCDPSPRPYPIGVTRITPRSAVPIR